jgi:cytochrome c-type biogenesis protein CcmF
MLYALRAGEMETRGVFAPVSREAALVLNNLLLSVAALVVFVGTLWPLVAEMAFDRKLSVGAPFFDKAFTPFMVLLALALPIGAILPWKRGDLGGPASRLWPAALLAAACAALAFAVQTGTSALAAFGAALGIWLIGGAGTDLFIRAGRTPRRLFRLPRADWGRAVAHAGLGVTFIGIAMITAWSVEDIRVARPGDSFPVNRYEIALTSVRDNVEGPNYVSTVAEVTVSRRGRMIATLHPEKRIYPVARMPTTEAAILNGVFADIYVVIGDPQSGGGWALRTHIKPFANWIWSGAILMALGGLVSLSDRRYRVGAGAGRTAPRAAATAAE